MTNTLSKTKINSTLRGPLPPGSWLGMLGGGQLGRMFSSAAHNLGYRVCVLDPASDSPAGCVADRHIQADYLDSEALDQLSTSCSAVTTEFENVPAQSLTDLAQNISVSPSGYAVSIAQDRIKEKQFIAASGSAVAPYCVIESVGDIAKASANLFPGILKSARLGYDGKGQHRVNDSAQLAAAWAAMGSVACVLEKRLNLVKEISVVVARGYDGQMATFPVAENIHVNGILAVSTIPANIDQAQAHQATEATMKIAQALDYVGVLCVEFFVVSDADAVDDYAALSLIVNEMAPRPHNSGHYTIDACVTSQFEQQVRTMAGLPLGSTWQHSPAVMLNILGDAWVNGNEPNWASALARPEVKLHLYGKSEARAGRKMGHITIVGNDASLLAKDIASELNLVIA